MKNTASIYDTAIRDNMEPMVLKEKYFNMQDCFWGIYRPLLRPLTNRLRPIRPKHG